MFGLKCLAVSLTLISLLIETSALPSSSRNCYADEILEASSRYRLQHRSLKRKDHGGTRFSYEGKTGPAHWADLDPANELCRTGKQQSPINFEGDRFLADKSTNLILNWNFEIKNADFVNEGVTVKMKFVSDSFVLFEGTQFNLKQFHFHMPSEHHINNRALDAEVHFVHLSDEGQILVVGALLQIIAENETENEFLGQILPYLPIGEEETKISVPVLEMASIIKFFLATKWNTYEGSLTTPPCVEGVRFFIAKDYLPVKLQQIREL
ncbi:hypothetical protein HK096_005945, partial [Nowakowskiella sp. JEL0078]